MGSVRKFAALGAFAVILPAAEAVAADMPEAVVVETPVPVEYASNWYLRGDLGFKLYTTPDAHFDVPGFGGFKSEEISNTGTVGLGFGYKFNDYFRTDWTLDYEWPGEFKGKLICPSPCTGKSGPEYSKEHADISAWTTLVNAYFDIPFGAEGVGAFSPYVGAGIGASYLTTSNVHFTNPDGSKGKWDGDSTWNFSWALTAGASYALSRNWIIDANYRFLSLGDARSGKTSIDGQRIKYDDIYANEFRVGLRYMIN